jgi:hypothetical protein
MQISILTTQLNDAGLSLNTKLDLDQDVNMAFAVSARDEARCIALKDNLPAGTRSPF